MKRFYIILAALACFAACGYCFWYFGVRPDYHEQVSAWLVFGPATGFLIGGIIFTVWACSDNIYNIKTGTVVAHDFTPEHWTAPVMIPGTPGTPACGTSPGTPGSPPIYVPPQWVADDWAIQLQDARGRTGWLHFGSDVFGDHPVGSYYGTRPATMNARNTIGAR